VYDNKPNRSTQSWENILERLIYCCYYKIQSENTSESNFSPFHYSLQYAHSILAISSVNYDIMAYYLILSSAIISNFSIFYWVSENFILWKTVREWIALQKMPHSTTCSLGGANPQPVRFPGFNKPLEFRSEVLLFVWVAVLYAVARECHLW